MSESIINSVPKVIALTGRNDEDLPANLQSLKVSNDVNGKIKVELTSATNLNGCYLTVIS